jgi:predicted amidohydrolase
MARLKVDTLLYSIAWVEDAGSDWFAERLPAIARANGFNMIAANWTVGPEPAPKWHGYGQSRIIDAAGNVVAKVKDDLGEEIVLAELPVAAHSPSSSR